MAWTCDAVCSFAPFRAPSVSLTPPPAALTNEIKTQQALRARVQNVRSSQTSAFSGSPSSSMSDQPARHLDSSPDSLRPGVSTVADKMLNVLLDETASEVSEVSLTSSVAEQMVMMEGF